MVFIFIAFLFIYLFILTLTHVNNFIQNISAKQRTFYPLSSSPSEIRESCLNMIRSQVHVQSRLGLVQHRHLAGIRTRILRPRHFIPVDLLLPHNSNFQDNAMRLTANRVQI